MGTRSQTPPSTAAQVSRVLEQVLGIVRAEHARATATGGSKPHVRITKDISGFDDPSLRALMTGIEFATRGHFARGMAIGGYTEWLLKTRLIDVTLRGSEGSG